MNTGAELRPMQRVPSYGEGARCIVLGCGNRPKGRDLCSTHYQQWESGVDIGVQVPDRSVTKSVVNNTGVMCLVCDQRAVNRGMCSKHAQQREAGIIDSNGAQLRELEPRGRRPFDYRIEDAGYILIRAPEGHPHSRIDGSILEHCLVMEDHLGRYLEEWEIVHHRDGDRSNNVLSNLEIYDGRANKEKGPGHHPGHSMDTRTAAQVILQDVKDAIPEAVASFLEGILNKGSN
jgi:hypothetical protein